jgi:Ca2+:H+ antiporter
VVAGTRQNEFQFSIMIAQTLSSFMFVATSSLILPAAFDAGLPDSISAEEGILALSRGTAIILFILYILFLVYQLHTHAHVFDEDEAEEEGVQISVWAAVATVLLSAVAVSFSSDYLVGSIDEVVEIMGISKTFVGLVLIPMVGNAGTRSSDKDYSCNSRGIYMCYTWIQAQDVLRGHDLPWVLYANCIVFDTLSCASGMDNGCSNVIEYALLGSRC